MVKSAATRHAGMLNRCFRFGAWLSLALFLFGPFKGYSAGTLTASFSPVVSGSNIDLTVLGKRDWVQWGMGGDYSLNRKASVTPLISNFALISQNPPTNPLSSSAPYWFEDTASSCCSWSDGQPVVSTTSNYTAVLAYSYPILGGSGFKVTVPSDTKTNQLMIFVGSSGSRGTFKATLTGQMSYSDSPLATDVDGVYTVTFAANSPGQTLTVEWTLPIQATNGYVSLRAAALTAPGVNNPPFALLTSPTNDTTFATPADIVLNASAEDFDGTVTNVVFYEGTNMLGECTTAPYAFTWKNAPLGRYELTAVATDNGGLSRGSVPVEIFVHGTNGSEAGIMSAPAAAVDLTSEGVTDWVHWGLITNTSIDRKSGVVEQISTFTAVGSGPVSRYADNFTAFSWSDGTPTLSVGGTPTGVFITGLSNGFSLTAPADTTPRQLRLYIGAYAARGELLAYLSDFSAQPYIDASIYDSGWNNEYGVASINYAAAAPGQQLIMIYRSVELLDGVWGNVTLQAATLSGGAVLVPVTIVNPACTGSDFSFSFETKTGCSYTVQASGLSSTWNNVTTIPGTGGTATVTNALQTSTPLFYRVLTQAP